MNREDALSFVATRLALHSIREAKSAFGHSFPNSEHYRDRASAAIGCNIAAAEALGIYETYNAVVAEHIHNVPTETRYLLVR